MKSSEAIKKTNLRIFTLSNSLMALAFGLFGSFYLIFINKIGGSIENFGMAVGLVMFFSAITSFIAGKYSDKIGRKPFLIISGYSSVIIILLYTLINSLWQLYLLQIFNGIISAIFEISEHAFLGDITSRSKRGYSLGRYFLIVGIVEAVAVFIGGILVGKFGFKIIFYVISLIFGISTTIMLKIRE